MTAGRRALLSAGFLGLAVLLAAGSARAQDRESHQLWQNNLTPEQIKAALARMGAGDLGGDLNPFQDMVKEYLLWPGSPFTADKMTGALPPRSVLQTAAYAVSMLVGTRASFSTAFPS